MVIGQLYQQFTQNHCFNVVSGVNKAMICFRLVDLFAIGYAFESQLTISLGLDFISGTVIILMGLTSSEVGQPSSWLMVSMF